MFRSERSNQTNQTVVAAVVLGLGFAGFFDGIVFHQILQWHHMLTATGDYPPTTVAGLETNTLADGLFHASSYVLLGVGLVLLWRGVHAGARLPTRAFVGWLLVGAGAFNLVEGIVNHLLLGIHHVREGPNARAYDMAFLVVSLLLVAIGTLLARSAPVVKRGQTERATDR